MGKTCRVWHGLLRDDQVWRNAFLRLFGVLPVVQRSYRAEFIQRHRRRRIWAGPGAHQLACYRFRDLGGVRGARLALDSRSLLVATGEAIVGGKLRDDAHLQRAVLYYPTAGEAVASDGGTVAAALVPADGGATLQVTCARLGPQQELAIGYEDGSVRLFPRISATTPLNKGFIRIKAPSSLHDTRGSAISSLPVQKIEWVAPHILAILCRRGSFPSCRLTIWSVSPSDVPRVLCSLESMMNMVDWCLLPTAPSPSPEDPTYNVILSDGTTITSTAQDWRIRCPIPVDRLVPFGREIVAVGLEGGEARSAAVLFVNPTDGTISRTVTPSRSGAAIACISRLTGEGGDQQLLLADEEGVIHCISTEAGGGGGLQMASSSSIIRGRVLDLAGDSTVVLALGQDSLYLFDTLGLQLLRSLPIPGRIRRAAGHDLDPQGRLKASILSFDHRGRVLVQWGSRSLHLWNFGPRISQMSRAGGRRNSAPERTPRAARAEISLNLREDLDAFHDEQEERLQMATMQQKFALEGLTEAEMVQYAQLLSLEEGGGDSSSGGRRPPGSPTRRGARPPVDSSDAELQLALQLSLRES